MKLGELAARLGCTLEGDAEIEIHGAEGLEAAMQGEVSFLSNPRYGRELSTTRASAVIVEDKAVIKRDAKLPALAALRSNNPYPRFRADHRILSRAAGVFPGNSSDGGGGQIGTDRRRLPHRAPLLHR